MSKIVNAVENGENVVLARAGRPVARLIGIEVQTGTRLGYGAGKGHMWIGSDLDGPIPEIESAFAGNDVSG